MIILKLKSEAAAHEVAYCLRGRQLGKHVFLWQGDLAAIKLAIQLSEVQSDKWNVDAQIVTWWLLKLSLKLASAMLFILLLLWTLQPIINQIKSKNDIIEYKIDMALEELVQYLLEQYSIETP